MDTIGFAKASGDALLTTPVITNLYSFFVEALTIIASAVTVIGAVGVLSTRARLAKSLEWVSRAYDREPESTRKELLRRELRRMEAALFARDRLKIPQVLASGFLIALTTVNASAVPRLAEGFSRVDLALTCLGTGLLGFALLLRILQNNLLIRRYYVAVNHLEPEVPIQSFTCDRFENGTGTLAIVTSAGWVAFIAAGTGALLGVTKPWWDLLGLVGFTFCVKSFFWNRDLATKLGDRKIEENHLPPANPGETSKKAS